MVLEVESVGLDLNKCWSAAVANYESGHFAHLIVWHRIFALGISVVSPTVLVAKVEDGRSR